MGSCCGLVGRGVAYDTRGPQFKTSYGQNRTFVSCQLYIRDENKEKEAGNGLLKNPFVCRDSDNLLDMGPCMYMCAIRCRYSISNFHGQGLPS